jgi:hypothetical protein
MDEELQPELNIGLSEEERDDLETLIKSLRDGEGVLSSDASPHEVRHYIETMTENIARLSEMVLQFDGRIKTFYEILKLSHQKSENMDERINTIIRYIKRKNNA